MKPAPFQYTSPRSVEEALDLLNEDAKVLAGGQSLMPLLNLRALTPARIVDINKVAGLERLAVEDGVLYVGAAVRQAQVEHSPLSPRLLKRALRQVALPVVRNRGTVAGSLCQQDPAAEMGAVARLYDARFVIRGPGGQRVVDDAAWFVDYYTTCLEPDELLVAVGFPLEGDMVGTSFHEVNRGHGAFALVGCAAAVEMTEGRAKIAKAALCGVGPVPLKMTVATGWTRDGVQEVAQEACRDLEPWDDTAAPGWYRKAVAPVLLERALRDAAMESMAAEGGGH